MNRMVYFDGGLNISVDAEEVAERLGELRNKTPAVIKVAANYTARETRKEMLRRALKRYAVTAKGKEKLQGLKQAINATNASPAAVLKIGGKFGRLSDFSYFRHRPKKEYPGTSWQNGPDAFKGQVLKEGGMKPLTGQGTYAKGFLAKFESGHLGMIQRQLGAESKRMLTANGYQRWRSARTANPEGIVEKTRTYEAPSGTAMHRVTWFKEEANLYAQETLQDKLESQIEKVLARAAAKAGR